MEQLLNSTMIKTARENMTQEQLDHYARIGEQFYDDFDMNTGESTFDPISQVATEIASDLRSGLHPTYLKNNEKQVLSTVFGEEWYTRFGYEKEDLDDIRL